MLLGPALGPTSACSQLTLWLLTPPQTFPTANESRLCPKGRCQFAFYGGESAYHRSLLGLQIFNAFMFFWLANFVLALGQVTLAGAFASYYWAMQKPDDIPAFPLFSAFGRALR